MICPRCHAEDQRIFDTRRLKNGVSRRRECMACGYRFSTVETYTKAFKRYFAVRSLETALDVFLKLSRGGKTAERK